MGALSRFGLALIPILIAIDLPAVVTIYLALTDGLPAHQRHRIFRDAVLTALVLGFVFMFLGAAIFLALGIDKADFQIGGGLILLVLSLADLVSEDRGHKSSSAHIGVVPLGTPLIIGPAVLTAITLIQNQYGNALAAGVFVTAVVAMALSLAAAGRIRKLIGAAGLAAISKIVSILLAAFAVHMVRVGVTAILDGKVM